MCVHLSASLILSFWVPLERSLDAYLGVRLCLVCVLDEFDVREEVCMCETERTRERETYCGSVGMCLYILTDPHMYKCVYHLGI